MEYRLPSWEQLVPDGSNFTTAAPLLMTGAVQPLLTRDASRIIVGVCVDILAVPLAPGNVRIGVMKDGAFRPLAVLSAQTPMVVLAQELWGEITSEDLFVQSLDTQALVSVWSITLIK